MLGRPSLLILPGLFLDEDLPFLAESCSAGYLLADTSGRVPAEPAKRRRGLDMLS